MVDIKRCLPTHPDPTVPAIHSGRLLLSMSHYCSARPGFYQGCWLWFWNGESCDFPIVWGTSTSCFLGNRLTHVALIIQQDSTGPGNGWLGAQPLEASLGSYSMPEVLGVSFQYGSGRFCSSMRNTCISDLKGSPCCCHILIYPCMKMLCKIIVTFIAVLISSFIPKRFNSILFL